LEGHDIHGFVSEADEQDFSHALQTSGFSAFCLRLSIERSHRLKLSSQQGTAIMANQAGVRDSRPVFFFDIDNCVCLKACLTASSLQRL
jgi:hypothetical protein